MNDTILFGLIFAGVASCVVSFVGFHIYRGLHDSLTNAEIGTVYNFEYVQPVTGDAERYMAKVIDVSKFSDDWIARLNRTSNYRRNDPAFKRSNNLITAQTFDGKIRNFYAERTRNVRRPLLGSFILNTGLAKMFL